MIARKARQLTPRDLEVLRLMAAGLTNQEVAAELSFSVDAAKIHAKNIYDVLGASSKTDAVVRGLAENLLNLKDVNALRKRLRGPDWVRSVRLSEKDPEKDLGEDPEEVVPEPREPADLAVTEPREPSQDARGQDEVEEADDHH